VRCQCGDQGHTKNNLDLRHIHVKRKHNFSLLVIIISIPASPVVWKRRWGVSGDQKILKIIIQGVKQNKTRQLDFRDHTRKKGEGVTVGQHFVFLYSVNIHAILRTSVG
jgi:ABC-type transporter MlaC component